MAAAASCGMMSEIVIWEAAELLVDCCGEDALAIAAAQVKELQLSEDPLGVTEWARIVTVVTKLIHGEKDRYGRKH
jgi:hypothetical protein